MSQSGASALISRACREAVAGKLAVRRLAGWARPFGMSETEFRLLWLLVRECADSSEAAIDQGELAERLAVSAAQISAVVERLRRGGFVECVRDAADRRRQHWRITAAGVGLVDAVVKSVSALGIPPLAPPFQGGGFEAETAA